MFSPSKIIKLLDCNFSVWTSVQLPQQVSAQADRVSERMCKLDWGFAESKICVSRSQAPPPSLARSFVSNCHAMRTKQNIGAFAVAELKIKVGAAPASIVY